MRVCLAFLPHCVHTHRHTHTGGATSHNLSWILMSMDCSIQKAPGGSKLITHRWMTPKHVLSGVCVVWLQARSCCTSLFQTLNVLQVIPTSLLTKYSVVWYLYVYYLYSLFHSRFNCSASVTVKINWHNLIGTQLLWLWCLLSASVLITSIFILVSSIHIFNLCQIAS